MSGLNPSDHDLLQPAILKDQVAHQLMKYRELNAKILYRKEMQKMAKVVEAFHDDITCGPEYVCTCCDQLWYRSSVRKCEANKYPKCSETLLKACIPTTTSIDNTKRICSTCHSNLS